MARSTWMAGLALTGVLAMSACGGGDADPAVTPTAPPAPATSAAPPTSTPSPAATSASATPTASPTQEPVPTADDLLAKSERFLDSATSARFKIIAVQAGQPRTVDVAGQRDGNNQKANLESGDAGNAEVLTVDGVDYIKGDERFLSAIGGESSAALVGKYVTTGGATMSQGLNLNSALQQLESAELSLGTNYDDIMVSEDMVDDVLMYRLSNQSGGKNIHRWVTADDEARLVKATGVDGDGQEVEMHFSEWNSIEPISAPAEGDIVRM